MSFPRYESYKDSSVEWLGEVPAHWETQRLKVLFEIKKRIANTDNLNILSVTQNGLKIRDIESNDGQISMDYSQYQIVNIDDFVMNHMDLLTGYVDISRYFGVTSPDYRVFCSKNEQSKARYFLYLFQNGYRRRIFYAFGQGASQLGRWRMPTDNFNDFVFPVPPLSEQAAIAAFLDRETAKIDALVEEQNRLIELLKEKRQAVISHAVTKGLDPNAPMKNSGVEWPGEVPAHWQVLPLTRVISKFVDYRGATPTKVDQGIPLITSTQIKNGQIDHALDPVFISEDEYSDRMTRGFPKRGDVVLTTEAPLGETAQIVDERVAPGQRIILMKVDKRRILNDYLRFHFLSDFGQNELHSRSSGSTASGIRADRLRASILLVPPLGEQERIVEYLDDALNDLPAVETAIEAQIGLLRERRSALIAAAVTGRIDVRSSGTVEAEAA